LNPAKAQRRKGKMKENKTGKISCSTVHLSTALLSQTKPLPRGFILAQTKSSDELKKGVAA